MPDYCYLVTEGQDDVEFIRRLLKPWGFDPVTIVTALDAYWSVLVPKQFPYEGDLQRRVPVPSFLRSPSHSIAIQAARGENKIAKDIRQTLSLLQLQGPPPAAIGVILDADSFETVDKRYAAACAEIKNAAGIELPQSPGVVDRGPPALGGFVIPDNETPGTLETLLLEAAAIAYPRALAAATEYVNSVEQWGLTDQDLIQFHKAAGRSKATVGAIAAVMRPGKSIQVSIHDNNWLCDETRTLPRMQTLATFLSELFGLPPRATAA